MFGVEFCYPLLKPRDGLGLALCDSGQRRRKRHSLFLGKHADSLDVHAKCESATAIQRNHFLIKLPPPNRSGLLLCVALRRQNQPGVSNYETGPTVQFINNNHPARGR